MFANPTSVASIHVCSKTLTSVHDSVSDESRIWIESHIAYDVQLSFTIFLSAYTCCPFQYRRDPACLVAALHIQYDVGGKRNHGTEDFPYPIASEETRLH